MSNTEPLASFTGPSRGALARTAIEIRPGSHWAILGDDTRAKSALCAILAGEIPPPRGSVLAVSDSALDSRRLVSFAQQSAAAQSNGFMQARYHSIESDFGPGDTVSDVLSFNRVFDINPFEVGKSLSSQRSRFRTSFKAVTRLLNLTALLPRDFLALSNGETRRVLLARAILSNPALLVLDDPCAGLDPSRREQFKNVCAAIAARGVTLVVSVRHPDEIPPCISQTLTISPKTKPASAPAHAAAPSALPASSGPLSSEPLVVNLKDISIRYGKRKLFDKFTFQVRRGERVVLRGNNGCGKTTLLSLIIGDNPLAYANFVEIFGIRRGPGADLNQTRRLIGMVSPELQAYSGLGPLELLTAALRKKPKLLLLDEPCLNLDLRDAATLKSRVGKWLAADPARTAICVVHRPEDIPPGFTRQVSLSD